MGYISLMQKTVYSVKWVDNGLCLYADDVALMQISRMPAPNQFAVWSLRLGFSYPLVAGDLRNLIETALKYA